VFRLSGLRPLLVIGALVTTSLTLWTVPALADGETCDDKPATMVISTAPDDFSEVDGTPGDDVIVVTTPDLVFVNGLGGDDTICGAAHTSIRGGEGNDELWDAWSDPDVLSAGTVDGEEGDDVIHGGDGQAYLLGGTGNDIIGGGGGADVIAGDTAITSTTAPEASDNDTIYGGAGADTIVDDWGNDTFTGGSGRDQLVVGVASDDPVDQGCHPPIAATATLRVADGTVTGLGEDTFSGFETYVGGTGNATLIGTSGPDDLRSGECGTAHLVGLGGADRLAGDSEAGGLISANGGDDAIVFSGPYDIHAGKGDDRIRLVSSNSASTGGPDREIRGSRGNDWVIDDAQFATEIDLRQGLRPPLGTRWLPVHGVENARQTKHHVLYTKTLRLTGTAGPNVLIGPPSTKKVRTVFRGLAGNDRLLGGRYDTAYGGPGRDVCRAQHRHGCERR